MKKLVIGSSLLLAAGLGWAQDVGRVISSTPVVQQQAVPRQVCSTEQVAVQGQKSGAGAALGAIAGGAVGGALGHGPGQAAAAVLGMLGGGIIGDRIEGEPPVQVQDVQRCATQTFYETRTVAYNVVYEFGGKQYSVQMPNDPGPSIRLQVTPVGALSQEPVQAANQYQQVAPPAVTYVQPANVIVAAPVQRTYYVQPYYPPPIGVTFGLGYWGGGYGHHHWR
jgi:uncharacterized protein YcfJ